MGASIAALKSASREGRHAQAIADCEALCLREPANREARGLRSVAPEQPGDSVAVDASHDRLRPWFEAAGGKA